MEKKSSGKSTSLPNSGPSHWDAVYERPLSEVPWEIETPPKELVELLGSGCVKAGGSVLDVACGSGNYSVFLAQRGFQVTGVDFSAKALALAKKRAKRAGVKVDFVEADVRHLADAVGAKKFDFVLDWCLLHHIAPADFPAYCKQFSTLLNPGGVLLMACFSEKDAPQAGLKSAVGKLGNVMYYRTQQEIEDAYRPLKVFDYHACRLGKRGKHAGHCFVLQKRQ